MSPLFEVAIGATDGFNRLFSVTQEYKADSPRVWLNGLIQRKDAIDGWVELGNKKVLLNEAPHVGDVVQIYYVPIP